MTIIIGLFYLLIVLYSGLILYYRFCWVSIPSFDSVEIKNNTPDLFISVVVPVRNEERNIVALLNSLRHQSYPKNLFEIIIVDDHSSDNTVELINTFPLENIRLISLEQTLSGKVINSYKKKAIETAVAASRGTLIVTTDADCIVPVEWLETIARFYEIHHPAMIVMPVKINADPRFIEIFQSLDFMTLQGITGAAVHHKLHNMCNGANLAYTKSVFDEVNGFENIDHIASGDDMLLMNKISTRYPDKVFYLKSEKVIVKTEAVKTVGAFFNQRIRWASKADKYEDKTIFPVLLGVYLVNVGLLALGMLESFKPELILYPGISVIRLLLYAFLYKTMVELLFIYPVAGFYKMKSLLWWFPFMQPFHILYMVIAGWLGKFGQYRWKERKVR